MLKKVFCILAVCGLVICASQASAQTISLELVPSAQQVAIGNQVTVEIRIAGLGDGTGPALGTFDLDITFNPTILSFSGLTFGDPNVGDQLDLFGLGSIAGVSTAAGAVSLFEVSLDL